MSRLLSVRELIPNRLLGSVEPIPTDMAVWLDASQITGLSDNDPVASWPNLARAENFVQGTGGAQPTYRTGILNGLPVVRFDGTGDHLDGSVSTLLSPMTGFVVLRPSGTPQSGGDFVIGNVGGNNALVTRIYETTRVWNFHAEGASSSNIWFSSTPLAEGVSVLVDWSYGGAGTDDGNGVGTIHVHGSTITAGQQANVSSQAICLGARDSGSQFYEGDLAEVRLFTRVLSALELKATRHYLSHKWGLPPP